MGVCPAGSATVVLCWSIVVTYLKKVNEGDEKNQTKKKLEKCFLSPDINCFFGNRQHSNALAGQKEETCFF